MVTTALQPIAPRATAKGNWVKTNSDGDIVAASRIPAPEESARVIQRTIDYLTVCEGRRSRLASLLNCHANSVFQWLSGEYTPSSKYLTTLLDKVLDQAASQQRANTELIFDLNAKIARLESRLEKGAA